MRHRLLLTMFVTRTRGVGVLLQNVTTVDWSQGQSALRNEVMRVTSLLRSVHNSSAPAVGQWNLAEVAMHLSQAWIAVPGLARKDLSRIYDVMPTLPNHNGSLIGDVWELADVTTLGVRSDPERNLHALADRIEARAADFLTECADHSADEVRPWLVEGINVPLPTLTYHLLEETVTHGYDIARADGQKWKIDPDHAAMVWDGFLMPVGKALGSALVDQKKAAGFRATYDVRIRGGGRYFFIFDNGAGRIEAPSSRKVDCHLSVDPVAFLLVFWGRINQWSAIAKGQLLAWGLKPWLGPKLRGLIRNP